MKIDKIVIENFGPFKKKQIIDFKNLNFFCIEGENGAGKSTIIDAIYFCLWGESLKGLDKDNLVFGIEGENNKKADYSLILNFSVDNESFEIVRTKKISFLKTGYKEFKGKEIEKELNKVGLYKDIMKKSFIIKQGAFELVLSSGKDEYRTPILNAVFGDLLEIISKKVNEKLEKIRDEITKYKLKLKDYGIEDYTGFKLEKIQYEIEEKRIRIKDLDKEISNLEQEIKSKREKEQELKIWINDINEIFEKYNRISSIIETLNKKFENFDAVKDVYFFYNNYKKKINILKELDDVIKKGEGVIKSLKEKIDKEENERDQILKEKDKIFNTYNENRDFIVSNNSRIKDIHRNIELIETEVLNLKKEKRDLENKKSNKEIEARTICNNIKIIENEISIKNNELESLNKKIEKLIYEFEKYNNFYKENKEKFEKFKDEHNEIEGKIKGYELEKRKHEENLFKKYKEIYKEIEEEYQYNRLVKNSENILARVDNDIVELENKYRYFLAHEIALSLKEGDTCPVCGSVFNSKNRDYLSLNIDQQEIKSFRKRIDGLKSFKEYFVSSIDRINDLSTRIKELIEYKSEIIREANEIINKIGLKKFSEVEETLKNLRDCLDEKRKKQEELSAFLIKMESKLSFDKERIGILEREIEEITKRISEIETNIENKKNIKREIEKEEEEKKTNLKSFLSDIGFNSLEELKEWLEKSEKIIEEKNKNITQLVQSFNDKKTEIDMRIGEKNSIISEINTLTQEIEKRGNKLGKNIGEINSFLDSIEDIENRINEYDSIVKELHMIESFIREKSKKYNFSYLDFESLKTEKEKLILKLSNLENEIKMLDVKLKEYEFEKKDIIREVERLEEINISVADSLKKLNELESLNIVFSQIKEDLSSNRFPKYIVQNILKTIVEYLNTDLLSRVLAGRYRLLVEDTKDKIEVFDNLFNIRRPTESLSGGEKFLLAFILALGFSKIIGKKIGLFFIDEGFGTLDDNNRRLIVELFSDIKRIESGRQIGIITHMKDISSFFSQKIVVEKDDNGISNVKVFS